MRFDILSEDQEPPEKEKPWLTTLKMILQPLTPQWLPTPPKMLGDGIYTTFAQGKRSYFRILRIMFLAAASFEVAGMIFFLTR